MSRRAAFNQADVTRAFKGAKAAGVEVGAVMIRPDGTMMIVPANDHVVAEARGDLDDRLAAFGAA